MNQCAKGKRGEREAAKYLTALGFPCRRGQQFSGGKDSPDVKGDGALFDSCHFEIKVGSRQYIDLGPTLDKAMEQAERDSEWKPHPTMATNAQDKTPLVLWRNTPRGKWRLSWEIDGVIVTTTGDGPIRSVLESMH